MTNDKFNYDVPNEYTARNRYASAMTFPQVIRALTALGITNITKSGKYCINATEPGGHVGLYDPRDLLVEMQIAHARMKRELRARLDAPAFHVEREQTMIDEINAIADSMHSMESYTARAYGATKSGAYGHRR